MKLLPSLLLIALTVGAPPAMALQPPVDDAQQKRLLTREEAAQRAQAQAGGGRVLGIKFHGQDGNSPYFDVKLLDKGKVRVLRIDAN